MKRLFSSMTLLASLGTLFCCFLPALFIFLGLGASFAALLGTFPQLIWLSENKALVFGLSFLLILTSTLLQYRARRMPCPIDPKLASACSDTRTYTKKMLIAAILCFSIGGFFAFIAPKLFS